MGLSKPDNAGLEHAISTQRRLRGRGGILIRERIPDEGLALLQAVDVDLPQGIRSRRQVGACRDIHFPVWDYRRAEFDSVSRCIAAVRSAVRKVSRVIRCVIPGERGARGRSFACIVQVDSPG
jgi:hypothetical protein